VRVLHLLKTAVGASWALRQMTELVRLGVEVHVALPEGPLVARYREAGIEPHQADVGFAVASPRESWRAAARLRQLVREIEPDLVHSHFVSTTLTMRLALRRHRQLPRVFQVPGPLHLEHAFFRAMEVASAAPNDFWIGSCQWTCDRYRASGVSADRVFRSFYGTDVDLFRPTTGAEQIRRSLGIAAAQQVIGMVAYMYAPKRFLGQRSGLKGHEDLIDALALVRARGIDAVGLFVGGAWDGAVDYERRVRAYGHARLGDSAIFLGTRPDVPDLLTVMDVVVHPSHSENLGAAVESLLLARPTIATHVGGLPDVVRAGETGWLVPPRAPPQLADAIVDALTDPARAEARGRAGLALIRSKLDVRRTAAEVADIYREILHRSGTTS
jgi:glycosyltransferase involved in cell wall biosynthesis